MLAPVLIIGLILGCAFTALFRPVVGIIAFYGFYLLQPEWNWRWTVLRSFDHQDTLAIATLIGTLVTFGSGNVLSKATIWSYASLATFLGLGFVSYLQTLNAVSSWFYLSILWKAILMAGLAVFHLDSPKKILAMMWVAAIAQGYNAYQINLQYFEDGFCLYARMRKWGFGAGDNNVYTNGVIPIIAISGALTVFSKHWWQKALAGAIALLQIHQVMLFDSRGGMMGAMIMAIAFFAFMPKNPKAVFFAVCLFIGGAALAGPSVVDRFTSSFQDTDELDASARSRFDLWRTGWRITQDHLLLGAGPRCGRYLVANYYPRKLEGAKALHNLFFEISTGCGLPAALLYLAHFGIIWFAAFRIYMHKKRGPPEDALRCALLALLAGQFGYWSASMFSSGALIESTYLCAAIGAAALCVHARFYPVQEGKNAAQSAAVVHAVSPSATT